MNQTQALYHRRTFLSNAQYRIPYSLPSGLWGAVVTLMPTICQAWASLRSDTGFALKSLFCKLGLKTASSPVYDIIWLPMVGSSCSMFNMCTGSKGSLGGSRAKQTLNNEQTETCWDLISRHSSYQFLYDRIPTERQIEAKVQRTVNHHHSRMAATGTTLDGQVGRCWKLSDDTLYPARPMCTTLHFILNASIM